MLRNVCQAGTTPPEVRALGPDMGIWAASRSALHGTSFHVALLAPSRLRSAFLVHSTIFHEMSRNIEKHRAPGLIMAGMSLLGQFT